MKSSYFLVATILVAPSAHAQTQRLVVPAFFDITLSSDTWRGYTDWNRIKNKGNAVQIVAALGGGGGFQEVPLASQQLSDVNAQFAANRNACTPAPCQKIFGYVDTGHAGGTGSGWGTGIPNVDTQVAEVSAWNQRYDAVHLDGIFFDDGPSFDLNNNPSPQKDNCWFNRWYMAARRGTLNVRSSLQIMINASQFPNDWVVSSSAPSCPPETDTGAPVAEYVTTWENTKELYWGAPNNCNGNPPSSCYQALNPGGSLIDPPAWWSSSANLNPSGGGGSKLAHIVRNADQYEVDSMISLSRGRGDGNGHYAAIYVYDHPDSWYGALACHFEEQAAAAISTAGTNGGTGRTLCVGYNTPADKAHCATSGHWNGNCVCRNLNNDNVNCGGCGQYCGAGRGYCSNGDCHCNSGYHYCGLVPGPMCLPNSQQCP